MRQDLSCNPLFACACTQQIGPSISCSFKTHVYCTYAFCVMLLLVYICGWVGGCLCICLYVCDCDVWPFLGLEGLCMQYEHRWYSISLCFPTCPQMKECHKNSFRSFVFTQLKTFSITAFVFNALCNSQDLMATVDIGGHNTPSSNAWREWWSPMWWQVGRVYIMTLTAMLNLAAGALAGGSKGSHSPHGCSTQISQRPWSARLCERCLEV